MLTVLDVALDPNWKLVYTEVKWDSEYYEAGVKELEDVVGPSAKYPSACGLIIG